MPSKAAPLLQLLHLREKIPIVTIKIKDILETFPVGLYSVFTMVLNFESVDEYFFVVCMKERSRTTEPKFLSAGYCWKDF